MKNHVLFQMKNVHKQFPGVYALKDVSFELNKGEVHGLLGENGAGKSTLIKVIGGIYNADQGELFIEEKKVTINGAKDAQNHGISIIHQELVLVPYMTVAENIFMGKEPTNKLGFVDNGKMYLEAQKLIDAFELDITSHEIVGNLTIAQQQMVEIIKAISFDSKIIVMDEPTSSLSEREVVYLLNTIRRLKANGIGIIYISHRMSEIYEITDRVTIMRDGQYIATVKTQETEKNKMISMMVGRNIENYYTRSFNSSDEELLKVENITAEKLVKNAGFTLKKGEILGFAGLVGAGRSELMKCIFGLSKIKEGNIFINGKQVQIKNPQDAMEHGIALVPENRKVEGLFSQQSVRFNNTILVLKKFIRGFSNKRSKEQDIVDEYIQKMRIKTASRETTIGNLSGGNQQKVILGRWLATHPKILILDEPTRGVDVGAKAEIYAIMNDLVSQGVSIIMVSSELAEVINMSDRVIVMTAGTVAGILERQDMTQEKIMTLATQEVH